MSHFISFKRKRSKNTKAEVNVEDNPTGITHPKMTGSNNGRRKEE